MAIAPGTSMVRAPLLNPVVVVTAILTLAIATRTEAATYYVATTGTNATTCGSQAAPCRTIAYAYEKVVAGDTIIVRPGTYAGEYNFTWSDGQRVFRLNKQGTASAPITLRSETKWGAIIDAQDNPLLGTAVSPTGTYHVIQDFRIINGHKDGIVLYGSFNKIVGNEIAFNGNNGDPSYIYGMDGIFSDSKTRGNQYVGNYIHDNGRPVCEGVSPCSGDHGLYLCGDDELVANNISVHNTGYGLQIAGYETVSNMRVFNNVFAENGRAGIVIWEDIDGLTIQNNLVTSNAHSAIYFYDYPAGHSHGVANTVIGNNLFYGNKYGDEITYVYSSGVGYTIGTNTVKDPLFVDPSAADYRLQSTSPAIDKGLTLPEASPDFVGTSRPQGSGYDLGPYEYVTQAPDVTAPASPSSLQVL
jgi:parallel beta-helix repeat protein